jgi:glycosyltransferase involved in cell wall biosynthesis
MQALSVVIISYNEEKNIGRCIRSVAPIADEVVVIDSFSDDDTVRIALSLGAIVKQSQFDGYINQKNKAINLATHQMVLLLDADEAVGNELAASILEAKKGPVFNAYSMNRCSFFCGKFITHGLWYPDKKLRLFNKEMGKCGGMDPHDRIIMNEEVPVKHLKGDLLHYTFDTVEEYLERNNAVSAIAARSLYEAGIKKPWTKIIFSPLWAFINGYFLRLGFLDGHDGYIIALHTANQSYMKYQMLRLLHRQDLKKLSAGNLIITSID